MAYVAGRAGDVGVSSTVGRGVRHYGPETVVSAYAHILSPQREMSLPA